jgi:hypothetical protein
MTLHRPVYELRAMQLSFCSCVKIHLSCDVPPIITDGISFLIKTLYSC